MKKWFKIIESVRIEIKLRGIEKNLLESKLNDLKQKKLFWNEI